MISIFTKIKSIIYKGKSVPTQLKNNILTGFIHRRDNEKYQLTTDKINLVQMRLRIVVCANNCMCYNFLTFSILRKLNKSLSLIVFR